MKSKFKQLECLIAWAQFYSNHKNLATPTNRDEIKFNKLQKEIEKLKTQLID